jgi:hypothetical protein
MTLELAEIRLPLAVQTLPSISGPSMSVVVAWLVAIFLSFSAMAPPNGTAIVALLIASFSVGGAMLLILELDRTFDALLRISSDTIESAVAAIAR